MGEEKSVLLWGGLGGLLAGILTIVGFGTLGSQLLLGFPPATTPEQQCMNVSLIRGAWLVGHGFLMIAYLLLSLLILALYRLSAQTGTARALAGGFFGMSGAIVFAANWAMVMVGFAFLSDFYALADPADQPMLVVGCQVLEEITHSFQLLGGILIGVAFVSLAGGLRARPDVHPGYVWASVVFGLLVAVGWFTGVLSEGTAIGGAFDGIGLISMLVLFFALGWKVYSLSRAA